MDNAHDFRPPSDLTPTQRRETIADYRRRGKDLTDAEVTHAVELIAFLREESTVRGSAKAKKAPTQVTLDDLIN